MRSDRRAQGEGSVARHKSGLFMARIQVNGQRHTVYGKTRKEANSKLDELKGQIRQGIDIGSSTMTVRQYSALWLANSRPDWALSTYQNYESAFRLHVNPLLGNVKLNVLRPLAVHSAYARMSANGVSPDGIHKAHKALHACLQQAIKFGLVAANPASAVDRPRVRPSEKPRLTHAQFRSLIEAATADRLQALVVLGLTTGARVSELLGLTEDSVDLERMEIRISRQLKRSETGRWELDELKTARSRRTIEIGEVAKQALIQRRRRQLEEQMKLGSAWKNELNLVFVTEAGTPIDRHGVVRRNWPNVLRAAGLKMPLTVHNMRDIFASTMLGMGMNIVTVSEMLGHADPSVTLRHYSWAIPNSGRQVAETMDALITNAS
jgi:integrase